MKYVLVYEGGDDLIGFLNEELGDVVIISECKTGRYSKHLFFDLIRDANLGAEVSAKLAEEAESATP